MDIAVPKLSLVVLIGVSGSGKSSFAKKNFLETEVLSSDYCRALVSDDENNQEVTTDAFEVLHFIAGKRLAAGKLTVIDATNVQPEARKPLVRLARDYHCIPVAIVFDLPEKICQERNQLRSDRNFGTHVIRQQRIQLRRNLKALKYEGFRHIFTFKSEEEVNSAVISRTSLWNDKTDEHGPFDIIGDVHGCYDELTELLEELGYSIVDSVNNDNPLFSSYYEHSDNRKVIFLGDIIDRGPRNMDCLKLVYSMVKTGNAFCMPGNHDMKFLRKLKGKDVQIQYGLAETLAELDKIPQQIKSEFIQEVKDFLYSLVSHYLLDEGRLVVAHAGLREEMQGRGSGGVRDFCLYGETTGETDEFGLPERLNWALEYKGHRTVVYGHTPVPEPEWLNKTVNIDTGCVFGGKLTAFRYPENEFVSVEAKKTYCEPVRPLEKDICRAELTAQQVHDDILDAEDVTGKRFISTRLRPNIRINEENATAALEVMSRFAVNPKWLIHLPPTMSPAEASDMEGYLEYPAEAFQYYRTHGAPKVVCEQKHMGSRAIVIICRDEDVTRKRFGITEPSIGIAYTRTGRQFFENGDIENELLTRILNAMDKSCFWDEFDTDWACFDCEIMPWSMKAQELLKSQYAAVGAAASASLSQVIPLLELAKARKDSVAVDSPVTSKSGNDCDVHELLAKYQIQQELINKYIAAYRQYCWKVESVMDIKVAPFHIMATEGKTYFDMNHQWHMESIAAICEKDMDILLSTPFKVADLTNEKSTNDCIEWWKELTEKGGEGMVVKPFVYITKGKNGIIQLALKCRGKEYLRIIYGPEYTLEKNLIKLRNRSLNKKRSLAIRELALGIESIERFIRNEPLRRVHECVFGVLALESEPVDPRL